MSDCDAVETIYADQYVCMLIPRMCPPLKRGFPNRQPLHKEPPRNLQGRTQGWHRSQLRNFLPAIPWQCLSEGRHYGYTQRPSVRLLHLEPNIFHTESELRRSVKRLFKQRFELGMWDPAEIQPYKRIPPSIVDSKEHSDLALQVSIRHAPDRLIDLYLLIHAGSP